MSTFCKFCGTPIEDGYVCTCPQAVAEQQAAYQQAAYQQPAQQEGYPQAGYPQAGYPQAGYPQQQPATKSIDTEKIKAAILDGKNVFLAVLKAPATAGKAFVASGNQFAAYALVGAQAIIAALVAVYMITTLNDAFDGLVEFSVITAILLTLVLSLAVSAAFAGILLGALKVFKANVSFETCVRVVAVRSIPFCIGGVLFLLALVLDMMNLIAVGGLVVFLCAFAYFVTALPGATTLDANKQVYVALIVGLLSFGAMFFIAKTAAPYYMPEELREGYEYAMEELGDNFDDLSLESIF